MTDTDLGRRLRAARIAAGLSQSALAERLDTTPQAVSLWELGARSLSVEAAGRFLAACGYVLDVRIREASNTDDAESLLALAASSSPETVRRLLRLATAAAGVEAGVLEAYVRALEAVAQR